MSCYIKDMKEYEHRYDGQDNDIQNELNANKKKYKTIISPTLFD